MDLHRFIIIYDNKCVKETVFFFSELQSDPEGAEADLPFTGTGLVLRRLQALAAAGEAGQGHFAGQVEFFLHVFELFFGKEGPAALFARKKFELLERSLRRLFGQDPTAVPILDLEEPGRADISARAAPDAAWGSLLEGKGLSPSSLLLLKAQGGGPNDPAARPHAKPA